MSFHTFRDADGTRWGRFEVFHVGHDEVRATGWYWRLDPSDEDVWGPFTSKAKAVDHGRNFG